MGSTGRYSFSVFWSSEDEAYIATCPEFPRLSAFGDSADEALRNITDLLPDAIATYEEEGWPLPEPFDDSRFSGKFQVRLARSQHAALARRAELEGVSMNSLVAQYVGAGLARAESKDHLSARLAELLERLENQLAAEQKERGGLRGGLAGARQERLAGD